MSAQSERETEELISVRLVTMDHYMASPNPETADLDPIYSVFKSAPVKKVPVLRVFGSTPAGQKACLHIHGIFPYLYVPMPPGNHPGFLYRLASSLDKAINMSMTGTGWDVGSSNQEHVFKVVEVSGRPFYGYHAKEHRFAKIFLYNPWMSRKAADLLASGSVMGQILQPHYGHIPYTLQFMMDYNLQGMSLIRLRRAKFRRKPQSGSPSQPSDSDWTVWSVEPGTRLFNLAEIPAKYVSPESVLPMSTCELELDAVATDIVNSNEDLGLTLDSRDSTKKSGNPGLEAIWQDERLRRERLGIDTPLTPPSSPPRRRPIDALTDSEKFWSDRFDAGLEDWRQTGVLVDDVGSLGEEDDNLDSTARFHPDNSLIDQFAVYPDETPDGSQIQAASLVEEHIGSLSLSGSQHDTWRNADDPEKENYLNDSVIDEDLIRSLSQGDKKSDVEIVKKSLTTLDSDDEELIGLLQELKDEVSAVKNEPDEESDSQESFIMTQLSQASKKSADREAAESLEMSQIVWDEDPDGNNSDLWQGDDSFWENYDFDSILNNS